MFLYVTRQKATTLLAGLCYAIAILAGINGAHLKGTHGRPEWSYYRELTSLTLEEATGPDKMIFGYLPGIKAILSPFLLVEPAGLYLFILANTIAVISILFVLIKAQGISLSEPGHESYLAWLLVSSAVPSYFAIQNNQVVALSVCLMLFGLRQSNRDHEIRAGILLAASALIKTLTIPIFLLPLLLGKWKTSAIAFAGTIVLSILLATATDGIDSSLSMHRRWIPQVQAHNPEQVFFKHQTPVSFDNNQSMRAEITRFSAYIDSAFPIYLHNIGYYGSLTLLILLTIKSRHLPECYWITVAAWMAWIAYGVPFGRYYYVLFLVPVVSTWYQNNRYSTTANPKTFTYAAFFFAILSKGHTPIYAMTTALVMTGGLTLLNQNVNRATRNKVPGENTRPLLDSSSSPCKSQ